MSIKLYNTLTRQTEEFKPIKKGKVGLYTCGPTVYNFAHIGNFRAYIFGDILKRALIYNNLDVNHIMNITDVDDKTIRESKATNTSLHEFTTHYIEEFEKDSESLNILPPTKYARAVEHIDKMVSLIEKLIKKGYAYKSNDGSVYFNVHKDKKYGQLSTIALSQKRENAAGRIQADEYDKDNADDFALWKAWDETDGDVFWETSLGKGRPGWHIECSAMSMEYLGASFDIHTGGVDLIFPHHENEIAQSECATGKKFVKYWLHNEWVMVEGKKMSKSVGNYVTLRTIVERGFNPIAYRFLLLQTRYRQQVNFTWEALQAAQNGLDNIKNQIANLGDAFKFSPKINNDFQEKFLEKINDDLNTPQALAVLQEVLKSDLHSNDKYETIMDFDRVLGLGLNKIKRHGKLIIPSEIDELKNQRDTARAEKNWSKSDDLRKQIEALGYIVEDTADGTKVSKK